MKKNKSHPEECCENSEKKDKKNKECCGHCSS